MAGDKDAELAARRALRTRLKTRFFRDWERPQYQTRQQFHDHVEALISLLEKRYGVSRAKGDVTITAIEMRSVCNDLGLLLAEVDDCMKYIAHLEQALDGEQVG